MAPDARRKALQELAIILSQKSSPIASETNFAQLIEQEFQADLRPLSNDEKRARREELFGDLRSSSTLTRVEQQGDGWVFSHNLLREYLVSEVIVSDAIARKNRDFSVPVTSAIRSFISSLSPNVEKNYLEAVRDLWQKRLGMRSGRSLAHNWDLLRKADGGIIPALRFITRSPNASMMDLNRSHLEKGVMTSSDTRSELFSIAAEEMTSSEMIFHDIDFRNSRFNSSILDRTTFKSCDLRGVDFCDCVMFECDLTGSNLIGANFKNVDQDINFVIRRDKDDIQALRGKDAIGYLRYNGAITDDIEEFFVYQHHPKFPIMFKIFSNIAEQRNSQLRELTQRGVAQSDPKFSRALIRKIQSLGLIDVERGLVSSTPDGRKVLPLLVERHSLSPDLVAFLEDYR